MTSSTERRKQRRCPSCGGHDLIRGWAVGNATISALVTREGEVAAPLTPYADICTDCGMVSLFVRLDDIRPVGG